MAGWGNRAKGGAGGAKGGASLGVYAEGEGTASEKQVAYAEDLRQQWLGRGNEAYYQDSAMQSAHILGPAGDAGARKSFRDGLYSASMKWLQKADSARMSRAGLSRFIDSIKNGPVQAYKRSMLADQWVKEMGRYVPPGFSVRVNPGGKYAATSYQVVKQ